MFNQNRTDTLVAAMAMMLFIVNTACLARAGISASPDPLVVDMAGNLAQTATIQLTVSGPADIDLAWTDYPGTKLYADKSAWRNFQGTDTIHITITRTAQENKSRRFILNFNSRTSGVSSVSAVIETRIKNYPSLLFDDIKDTYGYQHQSQEPFKTWASYAHNGRTDDKVAGVMDYYLTGSQDSLEYAKKATVEFTRTPGEGRDPERVLELHDMVYAYDFLQPYLSDSEDITVRNKIAELADEVYYDVNHYDGQYTDDIECVDYHIRAYAVLGIAGMLLDDYSGDPLPHGSTPENWLHAGTYDLFVKDTLHAWTGWDSMFNTCINSQGVDLVAGDYRGYYSGELMSLAQAYSHYYHSNMLDRYPIIRKWVTAPLYYFLPNGYDTNKASGGNVKWDDARYWINLLNDTDRSYMWKYYNEITDDNTLPFTRTFGDVGDGHPGVEIAYATYGDYSGIQYAVPQQTSVFSNTDYQVFRQDRSDMSAWLSFTTFKSAGTENRFLFHDDQMSFEYYNKGDYILGDSGEVKYRVTGGYGPIFGKGHNLVMVSKDASSNMAASSKGLANSLYSNASVYCMQDPSFEYCRAEINTTLLEKTDAKGERTVDDESDTIDPLPWDRSILFPDKEYFIVLDRVDNKVQRKMDTLFQLTSFKHGETKSGTSVGAVYGDLAVEGSNVNWVGLPYNAETDIATGSKITWKTTNVAGQPLITDLYSDPSSRITVEKYWTRVGGFDLSSEVDHPIIRYKSATSGALYRITAVDTRYAAENAKTFTPVTVNGGEGNAMKISEGATEAIVYNGAGALVTADKLSTDAQAAYVKTEDGGLSQLFIDAGSQLTYDGTLRFNSSKKVVASLKYSPKNVSGQVSGSGPYEVVIATGFTPLAGIASVKYNGRDVQYYYSSGMLYMTLSGQGDLAVKASGKDLSMSADEVFFSTNLLNGSDASISARVWNAGQGDAGPFTIKFFDGTKEIGNELVGSLAEGASVMKTISWKATPPGEHAIKVVVDYYNTIAEIDETDNQAVKTVSVVLPAGACSLVGDDPPCGIVSVGEILSCITDWAAGKASLQDVMKLITAWAND